MPDILQRIQDAVQRGEIRNPLVLELCDEIGKTVSEMPCKVGNTVYTNTCILGDYFRKKDRPYQCKVVFMGLTGQSGYINVVFKNGRMYQFSLDDFGKTVFLTQSEAEASLERKGKV